MKIYILTSVALFSEFGDIDSMETPSVCTKTFTSHRKAEAAMAEELETEKISALAGGYTGFRAELKEDEAYFLNNQGSGCSYNEVSWEITEHDVPIFHPGLTQEYVRRLINIVKAYGKPVKSEIEKSSCLHLHMPRGRNVICIGGWAGEDSEIVDELVIVDGKLGIGTEICMHDCDELPSDDFANLLGEVNENIELIRMLQEYFQPELIDTKTTPDELGEDEVFPTKEDCEAWMDRHGYLRGQYTICNYSGTDIDDPEFLNGDGENIFEKQQP